MKKSENIFLNGITFVIILTVIQIVQAENVVTELKDKITHHNPNTTDKVTIYTGNNYWGLPWSMTVSSSSCTDVPELLYKKASSIDTHDNCVILYGRQDCQGRHVKIAPGTDGHSHLSEVDFDKTLASLKSCNEDDEAKSNSKTRDRRNVKIFSDLIGNLGVAQPGNAGGGMMNSPQTGGNSLQTMFQSFNLNSLKNQLQGTSNGNSNPITGLLSIHPKK